MKRFTHITLCLLALATMSCRSSSYTEPSCANASDPGCSPFVEKISNPTGLAAVAASDSKITVSWSKPDFTGSFVTVLEMREFGTDSFTGIQVLDDSKDSYTVEGLEPLTKYIFRIKAIAGDSESEYTSETDATTLAQSVNSLFPIPTSVVSHYSMGTVKILSGWSNTAYLTWISSVQYQHKKENGGEWETIAMGPYGISSLQYIDNLPPHGYVVYRMIVTYTDQSVYTTAPSTHIMAVLETPTGFGVTTTVVGSQTKHLISWEYGTVPSEMSGYEILAYFPNLTQVGPSGVIQSSVTSYTYLPDPCPAGTQVSYWMRAKSNSPMVAPSNVTTTVVKTCP